MNESHTPAASPVRQRLAIIGAGSSGLISLKTALEMLPDWEVVCFEQTDRVIGCWGDPYPGFVSTSTKYTTQFSCFPLHDASVADDGGRSRSEFFRDDEYGRYLERFAETFQLRRHIRFRHSVERLSAVSQGGWRVRWRCTAAEPNRQEGDEYFDCVIICTGLAARAKPMSTVIPHLSVAQLNRPGGLDEVRNQRIVVFGGGESAVDYAQRLSRSELGNRVYLSLRTGVRVSPRYHPIHGVPSDFLRNRLMLSIHPDLRNWIGERFVAARMLHQELFERWFPAKDRAGKKCRTPFAGNRPCGCCAQKGCDTFFPLSAKASCGGEQEVQGANQASEAEILTLKKQWSYKLTRGAKDRLFNMFHNKSDDFLDSVARGRITIVGPAVDETLRRYREFDSDNTVEVDPDHVLPAIGFRSTLDTLSSNRLKLSDFYLGCCHQSRSDVYLVGFARPIIGNIPTISEVQARYVCGLISGRYRRPARMVQRNAADQAANRKRFAHLDLEAIRPVEMFAYCDRLARSMNAYPSLWRLRSLRSWWRFQMAPVTTMHYWFDEPSIRRVCERSPIHLPAVLGALLWMLKPLDWGYRLTRAVGGCCAALGAKVGRGSGQPAVDDPREVSGEFAGHASER